MKDLNEESMKDLNEESMKDLNEESMKDLNEESMKDLNEIMCDELMDAFTLYLVTYPERDEITLSEYYRLRRFWKQAAAISAELIVKHIGALA